MPEPLNALIEAAGGHTHLYGQSSGGALVLEAALSLGERVSRLALYEVPYNDDESAQLAWQAYLAELMPMLADHRRGDAVARFMRQVGTPAGQIDAMRHAPFWTGLEAIAPTLAYDHAGLMGPDDTIPRARLATLNHPALFMFGGVPLGRGARRHRLGHRPSPVPTAPSVP